VISKYDFFSSVKTSPFQYLISLVNNSLTKILSMNSPPQLYDHHIFFNLVFQRFPTSMLTCSFLLYQEPHYIVLQHKLVVWKKKFNLIFFWKLQFKFLSWSSFFFGCVHLPKWKFFFLLCRKQSYNATFLFLFRRRNYNASLVCEKKRRRNAM